MISADEGIRLNSIMHHFLLYIDRYEDRIYADGITVKGDDDAMKHFSLFCLALLLLILVAAGLLDKPVLAQPPFFAHEIPLAASSSQESLDAMALNATGEYLMVWQVDAGGGNTDIWARRAAFQPDFRWLEDAFVIANSDRPERAASIAYDAGNDVFLVAYEYAYSAEDSDVWAQRVAGTASASSDLIGPSLHVGVTTGNERTPAVSFLPTADQYLLVYEMDGDVWGRRVARRGQGDSGGDFLGDEFIIAADAAVAEAQPQVVAAVHEQYFLVTYSYAFSPDDDDILAQRVLGQRQNDEDLLANHFTLADAADRENTPTVAYSSWARAFIVLWRVAIPFNDDLRGAWVDAGNLSNAPLIGQDFDVAADTLAMESAPDVVVDAETGEVVAAFSYADMMGDWLRPALIWLNRDPHAPERIAYPLQALPARSFEAMAPRIRLLPNQSNFLMGYTARWGASEDADQDAYLFDASRWGVALPLILR